MPHPPSVREAVLADLASGETVPAVSERHGVPIGTVRRWKRAARQEADAAEAVNERRGQLHTLPPPAEPDPEERPPRAAAPHPRLVALAEQLAELEQEMKLARKAHQFGAVSSLRREWRALRDAYDEALASQPVEDPTDLPVAEVLQRLKAEAGNVPDAVLVVWVEEYLSRHEMRVVPA